MRKYYDMVGEVMAFLNQNHYCQTVIKYNQRCFDELGHHLLASEITYTPLEADQWFQSVKPSLSRYASENYRAALNKLRDAYETGIIRSGSPKRSRYLNDSMKDALDSYISRVEETQSPKTAETYRKRCLRFMIFTQEKGARSICDISYDMICCFHAENNSSGKAWDMLEENAVSAMTGNRDKLILILLFDLAVRVSELLDITIGDISLDTAPPSILIHGKGKKQRAVSPSPRTTEHLREYLKVFHGTEARPESFLFYTVIHGRTNRMSVRNVERIIDKYAKITCSQSDSMPKNCYPHMMRRTRATGMYQDGVPIEMVSVILGHSNTETTKIYAAPSVEQLRENMQKAQPENACEKKLWEGKEDEIRRMFGLT